MNKMCVQNHGCSFYPQGILTEILDILIAVQIQELKYGKADNNSVLQRYQFWQY